MEESLKIVLIGCPFTSTLEPLLNPCPRTSTIPTGIPTMASEGASLEIDSPTGGGGGGGPGGGGDGGGAAEGLPAPPQPDRARQRTVALTMIDATRVDFMRVDR